MAQKRKAVKKAVQKSAPVAKAAQNGGQFSVEVMKAGGKVEAVEVSAKEFSVLLRCHEGACHEQEEPEKHIEILVVRPSPRHLATIDLKAAQGTTN